jgi:hypothetical protein
VCEATIAGVLKIPMPMTRLTTITVASNLLSFGVMDIGPLSRRAVDVRQSRDFDPQRPAGADRHFSGCFSQGQLFLDGIRYNLRP